MAKIFQELQGNYGTRFLNQWKTGQILDAGPYADQDAGVVNAMAMWGKKLAGFADKPECIRRVLDHLPSDPPSLPQFLEMCRNAPVNEKPMLVHKLTAEDRERMAEAARQAKRAVEKAGQDKIRFWATHPRSAMHLRFIFEAAAKDDKFRPCIDEMVSNGICTSDGHLLKVYRGGQMERCSA